MLATRYSVPKKRHRETLPELLQGHRPDRQGLRIAQDRAEVLGPPLGQQTREDHRTAQEEPYGGRNGAQEDLRGHWALHESQTGPIRLFVQ